MKFYEVNKGIKIAIDKINYLQGDKDQTAIHFGSGEFFCTQKSLEQVEREIQQLSNGGDTMLPFSRKG